MFTYPSLLIWALPAVGLVVLIHLINMFRHRRVRWAAMEFLLAGYKKNRNRILLQQLLLLLLRSLAVLLIVLMLAQPRGFGKLADLFGTDQPVHHIILLDDSFSMGQRVTNRNMFDTAKGVVRDIVERAAETSQPQHITLVRFSEAVPVRQGEMPDLLEILLDSQGRELAEERLGQLPLSQTDAGPLEALRTAVVLSENSSLPHQIVYLVSDFRKRNWQDDREAIREPIEQLSRRGTLLRTLRCSLPESDNLAITSVKTAEGIRAAEIPVMLEATVRNFGTRPVSHVPLLITIDGEPQPNRLIDRIAPGEQTAFRFPVQLPGGGSHRVRVQLDPDTLAIDNSRYLVLHVPEEVAVLLIDGSSDQRESRYVRTALAPGGVRSGIRVQTEPPRFLRNHPLENFDTIFLLDPPELERSSVLALENFVREGGGLAIFAGPTVDPNWINETLYRGGEGIYPVPLEGERGLMPDFLHPENDLQIVASHPIFRVFEMGGTSLLSTVTVERYLEAVAPLPEAATASSKVLLELRGGHPLVVEKPFGKGRVLAVLTTASPRWNDWGRGNPSFVILMLESIAHLARSHSPDTRSLVGQSLSWLFPTEGYRNEVRFALPRPEAIAPSVAEDEDVEKAAESVKVTAVNETIENELMRRATLPEAPYRGFYEITLTRTDGNRDRRTLAVNVHAEEGDLSVLPPPALADFFEGTSVLHHSAESFTLPVESMQSSRMTEPLLLLVILLLLAESFLAGHLLRPRREPLLHLGKGGTR
jgi:hypothetical protein